MNKERILWLLRLKEGDWVSFYDGTKKSLVRVTTKDVLNNRIWLDGGYSVRCNNGIEKSKIIEPLRTNVEPIGESISWDEIDWREHLS